MAVGYSPGSQKIHTNKDDLKASMAHKPGLSEYAPVPGNLRYGYRIISGTEQNGNTDHSFRTYFRCRSSGWYR